MEHFVKNNLVISQKKKKKMIESFCIRDKLLVRQNNISKFYP